MKKQTLLVILSFMILTLGQPTQAEDVFKRSPMKMTPRIQDFINREVMPLLKRKKKQTYSEAKKEIQSQDDACQAACERQATSAKASPAEAACTKQACQDECAFKKLFDDLKLDSKIEGYLNGSERFQEFLQSEKILMNDLYTK